MLIAKHKDQETANCFKQFIYTLLILSYPARQNDPVFFDLAYNAQKGKRTVFILDPSVSSGDTKAVRYASLNK